MEDVDRSNKDTSEKLVSAAAAETASALTLKEAADDSSSWEELLDMYTSESLEQSIGASAIPETFSRDNLVAAGASESAASAQTLKEADVSSSDEVLISTASLEESITDSPPTAPCHTFPSSFRCEKIVAGVAESARRVQALRELELELDQFIAEECLGDSSSEDPTPATSPRAAQQHAIDGGSRRRLLRDTTDGTLSSDSSLGSKILSRCVPHCFYWYYIRMDRRGSFCTYPDRGGPFQSLQEAEDAIDRCHDGLWCQSWRDVQEKAAGGGPYSSTRKVTEVDTYRYLVEALLDQYNEDNDLIGNLAHEVDQDAMMMEQWIYEDHSYYYHYNFATKKNEAGDISLGGCTFFAEVSHKLGEHALEVNCCYKIDDEDNGWCYGCRNNGSHGMRHPKNSDAYAGGHLDVFFPCTLEEPSSSDDDDL